MSDRPMDAAAFNAWMGRCGLSLTGAALTLGVSRRTIGYYASGEQPIPLVVALATRAVDDHPSFRVMPDDPRAVARRPARRGRAKRARPFGR